MQPKQAYKTKQGEELLAYLKSMPGRHRTVAEIRAYFARQGRSIGTATIYRHLERLVEQGLVDKYTIDANSPACFAYTGHQNREQCGQRKMRRADSSGMRTAGRDCPACAGAPRLCGGPPAHGAVRPVPGLPHRPDFAGALPLQLLPSH